MVDGKVVFLPRPTTLVGAASENAEFTTQPLDVSQQGGVQFQVWRGPSSGIVRLFLEESLDGEKWVLGPSTPTGYELGAEDTKFFSYGFRLRWFRLRVELQYTTVSWPKVTMWAEGLLRAGGSGAWPAAAVPASGALMGGRTPAGMAAAPGTAMVATPGALGIFGRQGEGGGMALSAQMQEQAALAMQRAMDEFIRNATKAGK